MARRSSYVAEWIIIKYMFVPAADYCQDFKCLLLESIGFLGLLYQMYELCRCYIHL